MCAGAGNERLFRSLGAAIVVEADNQSLSDSKAPKIRADIRGNVVPNVATRPVNGEFFNAHIIFYEYSSAGATGIGELVNTTASATASARCAPLSGLMRPRKTR